MTARRCTRWALFVSCALLLAMGCATATVEDKLVTELEAEGLLAEKTERGLVLYLPDVLFDFDRDELTEPARHKIDAVAELIQELAPGRTISIEGHSDTVGTKSYNRGLSLRRARSVETELVAGGVDAERIVMVGYGERFPVAPNEYPDGRDNPEGRKQNRRVEVVIERGS